MLSTLHHVFNPFVEYRQAHSVAVEWAGVWYIHLPKSTGKQIVYLYTRSKSIWNRSKYLLRHRVNHDTARSWDVFVIRMKLTLVHLWLEGKKIVHTPDLRVNSRAGCIKYRSIWHRYYWLHLNARAVVIRAWGLYWNSPRLLALYFKEIKNQYWNDIGECTSYQCP